MLQAGDILTQLGAAEDAIKGIRDSGSDFIKQFWRRPATPSNKWAMLGSDAIEQIGDAGDTIKQAGDAGSILSSKRAMPGSGAINAIKQIGSGDSDGRYRQR